MAVMHGRELGREKRGREWQHGHDTAVVYLGRGVARTCTARPWAAAAKGHGSALLAVHEREWSGGGVVARCVVDCELGCGLNSRRRAYGGPGAGRGLGKRESTP